jgi:hypothetical protein
MIERLRANWRRELLYVGLAAMECCWLFPWQTLFLGARGQPQRVSWVGVLAIMLGALYLTRLCAQTGMSLVTQRLITLGLALLSTLLLLRARVYVAYSLADLSWLGRFVSEVGDVLQRIPLSLILFLMGLYLWWRGIELAQKSLSIESVGFSFRLGIVAFLWLFLAKVFFFTADAVPYALLYFLVGLMVMGLARIEDVGRSHVGIHSPFNAAWLTILAGSALAVSASSLLVVNVFSFRNIAAMVDVLQPVIALVARVTYPIRIVVAWLLEWVLSWLIAIFARMFGGSEVRPEDSTPDELAKLLEELRQMQPSPSTSVVWRLVQSAVLVLGLLFVLAFMAFSIGRVQQALQGSRAAEHETVWDEESVADDVRDALGSRWRKWRDELLARVAWLRGEEYSLASIRATYASLTRLAAASGYPRREAETPYEYVATLVEAFPDSSGEIELITEAYVRVHYGERSFSPQYVQRVRDSWLAIRARQGENRSQTAVQRVE